MGSMTPPQQVAEPADEPRAALIATCTCGRRIWRLALDSARWRHDNWGITCPRTRPRIRPPRKRRQRVSETTEARRLWAEANERAQQGRNLIDRSTHLRAEAFAALPAGVTLEFAYGPGREDYDFRLIKRPDESWVSAEGQPNDAGVVEEWWQAGNLRIREEP